MIGGIFETIGKTLGVGKDKYFLELDDAAADTVKGIEKTVTKATDAAKAVASDVADKAKDVADSAQSPGEAAASVAAKAKGAASNAKETAKELAEQVGDRVESAASKTEKAAKKGAKEETSSQPVAAPAAASAPDPEEIIMNAIAAGSRKRSGKATAPGSEPQNFSTDYLMPTKKMRRRRPGPSLNNYKTMAKDVNPRLR